MSILPTQLINQIEHAIRLAKLIHTSIGEVEDEYGLKNLISKNLSDLIELLKGLISQIV